MALFTPPSASASSSSNNQNDNDNNNKSSSSSSQSTPLPPVNPNRRYPNPSFGLSVWGPLVPASDCRECLYTLSFLQIAGGLFLWWVPAKTAFQQYNNNRQQYQYQYQSPSTSYATGSATSAGGSSSTTASAANPTSSPFPQPTIVGNQQIPASFTQYSQYKPSAPLPPPPIDGPSNNRFSMPGGGGRRIGTRFGFGGSGMNHQIPRAVLWQMRFVRVASFAAGAYLMFLAGLELVRLQLTFDPWAEDAAKARRNAEATLQRRYGATDSRAKVSTWFGPKGYRPVEYKEWKRRVDEKLEDTLEIISKKEKVAASYGQGNRSQSNDNASSSSNSGSSVNTNGLEQIADSKGYIPVSKVMFSQSFLSSLRRANRRRAHQIWQEVQLHNLVDDQFYDEFTRESGLDGPSSSRPETTIKRDDINEPGAIIRTTVSSKNDGDGDNDVDDDSPLTPEEEEELNSFKPQSPEEIDVWETIDAWDQLILDNGMSLRVFLHHVPIEVRYHIQQEQLRKQEELEREEQEKTIMAVKEIIRSTQLNNNDIKQDDDDNDDDGYDYYEPKKRNINNTIEDDNDDDDDDLHITFGKPSSSSSQNNNNNNRN